VRARKTSAARRLIIELLLLGVARGLLEGLHGGQQRLVWAVEPADEQAAPAPVDDPPRRADRVALLSGRRWGKSEGILRYACALCCSKGGVNVLYVGLNKDSAKEIAWPLLRKLEARYRWPDVVFDERRLVITFANGSRIRIVGADHPRFARLLRGQEYDLCIVDEAQDFVYVDLAYLCDQVLGPTLEDRDGRLFMCGTPGMFEAGYFYEVVWKGLGALGQRVARSVEHPDWIVVHGEPWENPHNSGKRQRRLEALRRKNPRIEDEPWVQREFFGRWTPDNRALMVSIPSELCYLREWEPADDEEFLLCIDWGWHDPSAYVLAAWNPHRHNDLVYLEGWSREQMMLADHRREITRYLEHPLLRRNSGTLRDLTVMADPGGSAKTIVEELKRTYGLPIQNADKEGKALVYEQLNMDASLGHIKFFNIHNPRRPEDNGVAQQWRTLGWRIDPITRAREEGEPRHISDCAVYIRKRVRLDLFEERVPEEIDVNEQIRRKKERIARGRRRRWRS
jgi:hypothetical protein